MGRQANTQPRLDVAIDVLTAHHPMTVRQVYYQLVSRQVIKNSRGTNRVKISVTLVDN
jgi:hypothetical protein